jgi:hypothetical protein
MMRVPTLFNDFWIGAPRPARWLLDRVTAAIAGRWSDAPIEGDLLSQYVRAIVPMPRRQRTGDTHRILVMLNVLPEVALAEPPANGGLRVLRRRGLELILKPGDVVIGSDALLDNTLQIHVARDARNRIAVNLFGGAIDQAGLDEINDHIVGVLERLARGDCGERVLPGP